MALPELTKTLDDDFVNTWYEIRADVIDNINESTVFNLALREFGCYTPQVGGEYVTRTIGYGTKSTQPFVRGSVLSQSVPKLDTLAMWEWRYFLVDVNRTLIDDAKNSGPSKIKDYLTRRLGAARDAIVADTETYLHRWGTYTAAPVYPNGLYDIVSCETAQSAASGGTNADTQMSGTANGGINKTNKWWRNWFADADSAEVIADREAAATVAPYSLNLVPDMRHFFNLINAQQGAPNFILMDQAIYEAYEDEVGDRQQIVRTSFSEKAADLGFVTLTFKGAPLTYSSKLASTKHIFMLNMNDIEIVYDPEVWYDMTDWMYTPNQLERVAYIAMMTTGLITAEPRRHGVMEYAS